MMRVLVSGVAVLSLLLGGCNSLHVEGLKSVSTFTAMDGRVSGYEQGKAQLKAGNPALAIEAFRQEMSRSGASAKTLNGLAAAYQALGRLDIAQSYLEQALATDPGSAETAHNLSVVKYAEGAFDEALRYSSLAGELAAATAAPRQDICESAERVSVAAREAENSRRQAALEPPPLERTGMNRWSLDLDRQASPLTPHPVAIVETQVLAAPLSTRPAAVAAAKSVVSVVRRAAIAGPAKAAKMAPVQGLRIVNVVGRTHMAARMASYLKTAGVSVNGLANAKHYTWGKTEIRYTAGNRDAAQRLAKQLPVTAKLVETGTGQGGIELRLGSDLLAFDQMLKTA